MKLAKATAVLLITLMFLGLLASCAPAANGDAVTTPADQVADTTPAPQPPVKDDTVIRIGGMTGPTSIGLVKVMEDNANGTAKNKYDFTIVGAADEITPKLVKGELDIAALPANVASVLYNNTQGKVKLLAINTLGVLSILEKGDTIKSVADLKGKVIYAPASGKGSTPEYALNFILTSNGLDPAKDVTIEWKSEVTEILAALKKTDGGIAMLPQPAATNALNNVEGLREAINLNDAWNALGVDSKQVTGVIVVRKAFAEANPEAVKTFLKEYEASTKFANENLAEAAKLVGEYKIAAEAVALKAIPKCNITFIKGEEMKNTLSAYLKTLFDANAASVGGSMPADEFYYVEK